MKIAVAGLGYVGFSNALALSQHVEVVAYDVNADKVAMINKGISPIADPEIEHFWNSENLDLQATSDFVEAFEHATFVIIATPTDYDFETNRFNTTSIELVAEQALKINPNVALVIKSTVPVGFTESLIQSLKTERIIVTPEFLREGRALYDNLYPSRIVVGGVRQLSEQFASLLLTGAHQDSTPTLFTSPSEAEAIKLFSNTFLAMRVSFFNELDSFSETHGMDVKTVIEGVCLDPRVGAHYNNPSFGYGGYCLPKDTKQLLTNFSEVPQELIRAIIESNSTRKRFIAEQLAAKEHKVIGVYRLVMKHGSDNFRDSSILGVIESLMSHENAAEIIIYEPSLESESFLGCRVINNFEDFISSCEIIVSNRWHAELAGLEDKVYSRDIFGRD